jgi:hypothetical protein
MQQRALEQVEGQINRLKTLKRAMYGRAGVEFPGRGSCRSYSETARQMTKAQESDSWPGAEPPHCRGHARSRQPLFVLRRPG